MLPRRTFVRTASVRYSLSGAWYADARNNPRRARHDAPGTPAEAERGVARRRKAPAKPPVSRALDWREESLTRNHNRSEFDCGVSALNEYLRRYARQNHESGGAKTFVAVSPNTPATVPNASAPCVCSTIPSNLSCPSIQSPQR